MQDIDHALAVLSEEIRLPNLQLNANGQAEIVLGDGLSLYITQIEPTVSEWSFRLDGLDFADPAMMQAMLEANCLGRGTGAGRLAIDAGHGGAIYCERWDVSALDARGVSARFQTLVQYGTFWSTEGTSLILDDAQKHHGRSNDQAEPISSDGEAEMLIRL